MASMKDIKTRIRSVESTQQITRAMELVATSKLRHARERVERSRPFHEVLGEAIAGIQAGLKETPSVYSEVRPVKKTCFVVIGGDRGLAGGYNANLHRLVLSLAGSEPYCVLPIGKMPLEQFTRSGAELVSTYFGLAASVGIGDCMQIARLLCDGFAAGRYDRVTVVYTEFRSMLSQVPASADVLPLQLTGDAKYQSATVEDDPAALVAAIVPQYVSGVLYSALCDLLRDGCLPRAVVFEDQRVDELTGVFIGGVHGRAARAVLGGRGLTEGGIQHAGDILRHDGRNQGGSRSSSTVALWYFASPVSCSGRTSAEAGTCESMERNSV